MKFPDRVLERVRQEVWRTDEAIPNDPHGQGLVSLILGRLTAEDLIFALETSDYATVLDAAFQRGRNAALEDAAKEFESKEGQPWRYRHKTMTQLQAARVVRSLKSKP